MRTGPGWSSGKPVSGDVGGGVGDGDGEALAEGRSGAVDDDGDSDGGCVNGRGAPHPPISVAASTLMTIPLRST